VSFFVTGTDTGVGKTHTVVQLLRLLRASGKSCVGFKPICCGDRRDAELLLAAGSEGFTIDEINPLWLRTPAAPFAAALIEKVKIEIEPLLSALAELQKRVDHVFVEGVGGWLVPIQADYFVSNLAAAVELPVLIVAENRLGCLNHTLLTLRAVSASGLVPAAVVLNTRQSVKEIATSTNAEILEKVIDVPLLPGLTEEMRELPDVWRQVLK
jgi:dethiobiotin synthetase